MLVSQPKSRRTICRRAQGTKIQNKSFLNQKNIYIICNTIEKIKKKIANGEKSNRIEKEDGAC